jgi:hypothetical protein
MQSAASKVPVNVVQQIMAAKALLWQEWARSE